MIDFSSGGIFAGSLGQEIPPEIRKCLDKARITCHYGSNHYWAKRYKAMLKEFTGFESVAYSLPAQRQLKHFGEYADYTQAKLLYGAVLSILMK